ncbi:hypothetical protein EGW08_021470 [Elysia chlorotica]|uniref:Uncharacterized protein n=1 Tax=Elysia chlorotica TaxID=188477 RepID=A0A3S1ASE2_ELYCH|nr:hypothetical protein EGW08_021470 [Elysia chlorotica]
MRDLFQAAGHGRPTSVDSFRACAWLLLLALCGVTWLLPLSPAVNTLESNPRPLFSVPKVKDKEKVNTTVTDGIVEKALKAARCDTGYDSFGQDCELLKDTLGQLNKHLLDQGQKEDAGDREEDEGIPWNQDPDILPDLTVNCWCPAQFEPAQVAYTNSLCASNINRYIRGLDLEQNSDKDEPHPRGRVDVEADEVTVSGSVAESLRNMTQRKVYRQRKDVFDRYNHFVTRKTSFLLFVFGLVLLAPSLMWWKLAASTWCALNVDTTLDTLRHAQSCEPDVRGRIYQDISRYTSSGHTAKCFLLCKLLVCCASLVALVSVSQLLHVQANTLAGELEELSDMAKLAPLEDQGLLFHCFFTIRMMQNQHDYTVQCSTSFSDHGRVESARQNGMGPHHQLDWARRGVLAYGTLFQIVAAFLIMHATFNLCGFLEWVRRIYVDTNRFQSGTQNSDSDRPSGVGFAEDVRFLLHTAHAHLGHVVCKELAVSLAQGRHGSPAAGSGGKPRDAEDNF